MASLPRHILLSGATGDIGQALTLAYAEPGVTLYLTGRNPDKLERISTLARERGAEVISQVMDIAESQTVRDWVSDMDAQHPIDLVIANAGITGNIRDGGEDWQQMEQLLEINLKGALATIEPLIGPMRSRGHGQIALISSLSAYYGLPLTPAYCASKAALKAYGEALHGWLGPQGIRVSVVLPGFVKTAMSDSFPGPKPFMLTPERAAQKIRHGLARGRARISFPFPLNLGMWWLAVLPPSLSSRILALLNYGG